MLSRRDFVKGGVALVSIGTTANSLLKGAVAFAAQNPALAQASSGKILVLVQLAGGNDFTNTLVPYADPAYYAARPTLGTPAETLLKLDDSAALAPQLTGLKGLWDEGRVAFVRGVGYPNQNYSHFKSMAIWEAGDPELKLDQGWLGRTLDSMESEAHDPFFGFNAGGSTPPELRGELVPVTAVANPNDFGFRERGQAVQPAAARSSTLMKLYEEYPANSPFGVLLETTAETAVSASTTLTAVHQAYVPAVEYPDSSFAAGLKLIAETITGGLGIRVGHVTLGGFDTHTNQQEDHPALLQTLDEGLTAFYRDLAAHGRADDVVVATWTEFSRRVEENANGSTDHGSAGGMIVLGNGVERGIYGDQPSLTNLIDRGNLLYTVDFRSVYATLIEKWLGVPSSDLMGQQWPMLPIFRAA